MTGIALWIMLGMLLPIFAITALTPVMTRKTEAFGVTIPEQEKSQPFIAGHIKRYMLTCLGLGLVIMAGLYLLLRQDLKEIVLVWSYTASIFIYALLTFVAYYTSHRAIKKWKQQQPWYNDQLSVQRVVVQTNFHQTPFVISIAWYIPHLLIVALTMAYSLIRYDDFPDMLPMQYGFDGEVTRAVEKSIPSVLMLSFVALTVVVVFLFVHYSIVKAKQVIESHDPEGSLERNRLFRYAWSVYCAIAGFLVTLLMCLMQLATLEQWDPNRITVVALSGVGILIIGAITLSLKLGQGGSRIVLKERKNETMVHVADHDKHWKAGLFYWNPNDPAIFVEKRFGVGWSLNYGNPRSWLVLLALLVLIAIPAFLDK